jgi:serine/threonine protein kinase
VDALGLVCEDTAVAIPLRCQSAEGASGDRTVSSSDTDPTSPVPIQLGRYQLLDKLGQGGMGEVYLAHDASLDRSVALKLLPHVSVHDPDALARFRREARALAKLSHPGIVQAFDSDSADGRHFLVMEYVEGHSLGRLLKEHGRLPPGLAADYIRQAALALQHAHERGLIHRDLKPSNLLVTPQGQVKLLDLGLARFLQDQVGDANLTREGAGMGTPDYCAPEQYRDAHRADGRADVYALGCTLYHLLTGHVPFPGTSLSEKYRAHDEQEPQPVGESCPEVPVGLVAVLRRMMAKRPQDRFRSAGEAAAALAPFVADCSPSAALLQTSVGWDGSQLTMTGFAPAARRRKRWGTAGIIAAFVGLLALLVWSLSRPGVNAPANTSGEQKNAGGKSDSDPKQADKKAPTVPQDPNVLTVAQDGSGQFRSIRAALAKVDRPGMTIRVLDDGVYEESVLIDQKAAHANLRLEAVRRATLVLPPATMQIIAVRHVPGVTVRGFRCRVQAKRPLKEFGAILVYGQSPGTLLEDLEILADEEPAAYGIILQTLDLRPGAEPVVVQGCRLRSIGKVGVVVTSHENNRPADPCRRIILRNNQLERCQGGVILHGALEQVQVVGNRIWGSDVVGIQLENVTSDTHSVLIANNTFFNCRHGWRVWDSVIKGKDIQFRNNLLLASREQDMLMQHSSSDPRRPGNGQAVRTSEYWRVGHNWREGAAPREGTVAHKDWIPPEPPDVLKEQIKVVSRNPGAAGFLRPLSRSLLGTEGAGKTDPALPSYIGAVPPEGVQPWDWHRTWLAPPPGQLLTVSQRPEDGGEYRSIGAALAKAKPWATIRVLDDATYRERILLDDPKRHEGIVLEAPQRAILECAPQSSVTLTVHGVPHVRVRHFQFRARKEPRTASWVVVAGHTPGLTLEGLDLQGVGLLAAISLQKVRIGPEEDPLVIRDCRNTSDAGIMLVGPLKDDGDSIPSSGIAVLDSRLSAENKGVVIQGRVERILVAGNRVWNSTQAALQAEDLTSSSRMVVLANNTAFQSGAGFRLWNNHPDQPPRRGQVLLFNNLFFEGQDGDVLALQLRPGGRGDSDPERARTATTVWRFACNWRDTLGVNPGGHFPLAPGDTRLDSPRFVSRAPQDPAFMRPAAGEKWALQGAGRFDPTLPRYVGAVPPRGVEPWDWNVTWRAWMRRDLPAGKANPRKKPPADR